MFALILSTLAVSAVECELPNLSVGHLNITSEKEFKDLTKAEPLFFVALSAKWCAVCCRLEPSLIGVMKELDKRNLKLVRIDLSTQGYFNKFVEAGTELPHLYTVYHGHVERYRFSLDYFEEFVNIYSHPFVKLNTEAGVVDFFRKGQEFEIKVIGFIYETTEGFLEKYQKARLSLTSWPFAKFGLVTDKDLIKSLKAKRLIQFYNSIAVSAKNSIKSLELDLEEDIVNFISRSSIGVVEQLTANTSQVYIAIGLPMLLMFIDENNADHYRYVNMLEKVGRDYSSKISFAWIDGKSAENQEKKKSIGLYSDKLPSMAFNNIIGKMLPFDETKEITQDAIQHFCADFLNDRLKDATPVLKSKSSAAIEQGYKDTEKIFNHNLMEKVIDEGSDVMLLLYDSNNENITLEIGLTYNHVATRFKALKINSVKVYRIDAATEPIHSLLGSHELPAILFFPAYHKQRPFIQFTGDAYPVQLMFFVKKYADIEFELPEMPHMDPNFLPEYREGISKLDEESRKKIIESNERRDWGDYF